MNIKDYALDVLRRGFSSDIGTVQILLVLAMAMLLGAYIYVIYRLKTKAGFYSRDFNNGLAILPVITAGIVLAMQSSIVISLGMVGALSIVRFRNAVKSSLDLVFLFWSISIGIIVGAGIMEIAFGLSFAVTVLMFALDMMPARKAPYVLVIHGQEADVQREILPVIEKHTRYHRIKSREISGKRLNLVVEVRTDKEDALVNALCDLEHIDHVNLLSHDGELRC